MITVVKNPATGRNEIAPGWLEDASMTFESSFDVWIKALGDDWNLKQDGGDWTLRAMSDDRRGAHIGNKRVDLWEAIKRAWQHIDKIRREREE